MLGSHCWSGEHIDFHPPAIPKFRNILFWHSASVVDAPAVLTPQGKRIEATTVNVWPAIWAMTLLINPRADLSTAA